MVSPDKHNWEIPEGVLCLWGFFSYDLEGLAAGAGQLENHKNKADPEIRICFVFSIVIV